jgi:hypothetical protein
MTRRLPIALAFAWVMAFAPSGRAEQLIIADVTYTHSAETTTDSHYFVTPLPGTPADWTSPIDWTKGSVHVRLEVKTKPTATPTRYEVCFDVKPEYGCTLQTQPYTEPGVYDVLTPFSRMWYPTASFDWSQGVRILSLILKDDNNGKPQGNPLYVPTDLRVEVALLSEGAVYVPRTRPDAGPGPQPDAGGEPADAGVTPPPPPDGSTTEPPPKDSSVDPPDRPLPEGGDASFQPGDAGGAPSGRQDSGASGPESGGSVTGPYDVTIGGKGCAVASEPARSSRSGALFFAACALLAAGRRRRLREP